ncbi:MAG: thioredoxin domain-containing protein [Bacteroidota bacterium]
MASNLLHLETSPYMLQHAQNPVHWQPWTEEAFLQAQAENKLIILSIGYAACHWCHVMEHESFSDEAVASLMNQHYICIKVDREEHPEVDHIYMDAIQLINGNGGWPLNCFLLPDKRPFYGGTYFRKDDWMNLLTQLQTMFQNSPHRLTHQATAIEKGLNERFINIQSNSTPLNSAVSESIWKRLRLHLDFQEGGLRHAPKFPMPVVLDMLLQYAFHFKNAEVDDFINLTLRKMAMGGIYDQIGGGFSRYATDEIWRVPHFEKMLYDNAQMISLYSFAYQKYKQPLYKKVVYETIAFVKNQLTSPEGGFYAAMDADSEGEEGKYYVWDEEEFHNLLGENAEIMARYYHVLPSGNWDGKNILYRTEDEQLFAENNKIDTQSFSENLQQANKILLENRQHRIPPITDHKIIASWNALMLKALSDAYRVFNDKDFLQMAIENAAFIQQQLYDGNILKHVFRKPEMKQIAGFLDDYAFSADAFISLFEATFDPQYLLMSKKLMDYVLLHFANENQSLFYYTDHQTTDLFIKPLETYDNVMPSSNAVMAKVLLFTSVYFENTSYHELAKKMLEEVIDKAQQYPQAFAKWITVLNYFSQGFNEVSINLPNPLQVREELDRYYFPNLILMAGENEDIIALKQNKSRSKGMYVCKNQTCYPAINEVEELIKTLSS